MPPLAVTNTNAAPVPLYNSIPSNNVPAPTQTVAPDLQWNQVKTDTSMPGNIATFAPGAVLGAETTVNKAAQTAPTVDPQAAAKANNQNLINTQQDQALALTRQNLGAGANAQRSTADNFLQQLQQGQLGINQDRQLTQYNKLSSVNDLVNSIRNGINSGGVALGNANALNSSAAEGLARAYNAYGSQAQNSIEGQSNLAGLQDDQKQQLLQAQGGQYRNSLDSAKQQLVDNIGSDIYSRLNVLNAQAQAQGLSPIDIAGQKQALINEAQQKLQGVDDYFASMLDPNQNPNMAQQSNDQAANQAYQTYTQGIVPQNAGLYSYDRTPTTTLQGQQVPTDTNAAPIASLPLFTKRTA